MATSIHRAASNAYPGLAAKFAILYRDGTLYLLLLMPVGTFLYNVAAGIGANDIDLSESSGNVVQQVLILIIFANGIALSVLFKVPLRTVTFAVIAAAPMIVWIVLSLGWSDFPSLTVRRASREVVEIVSTVLLALLLQSREAIMRVLFRAFFVTNLFNLASLAAPSLSMTPIGFAGIYFSKNTAGMAFFCSLPIFAIGIVDRAVSGSRLVAGFAFLTGAGMLALTLSKSAVGVGLISLFLVFCTRVALARNIYGRVLAPFAVLAIILALLAVVLSVGIDDTLKVLFGDATFTGRDEIWRYALYKFSPAPLSGVGYGALWQVGENAESLKQSGVHWLANQAHNGYIDVLAQLGYVGLFLLVAFLVHLFVRILRYASWCERYEIFGLGSYALYLYWGALIYNVTESSFFRGGHIMWILLVFVSTCVFGLYFRESRIVANKLSAPLPGALI